MDTLDSRELGFAAIRQNSKWCCFSEPEIILSTYTCKDIIPILNQVEEFVTEGKYAVGFVGYEAAQAFDSAFVTLNGTDGFPLVWFGIYSRMDIRSELPSHLSNDLYISDWSASISRKHYRRNIERIKREIESGNIYQINYSFRQHAKYNGDPYTAFTSFTDQHSTPYAAFINTGLFKVASLSPELFFSLDGSHITCRPMKGTAARGKTLSEDKNQIERLLSSSKDQAENLMIVDMIRNDLGRIAEPGSVTVDELFTLETYETLFQMTTNVSARTQASFCDIFKALFPSASITGAPKIQTMKLIHELETDARDIYTGSIGYFAPNRQCQFNVAIRTLTIDSKERKLTYGTGSGVVWDSQADQEFAECQTKTKIVRKAAKPFDLFETMRWCPSDGFALLDYHLRRLEKSAKHFLFQYDSQAIRRELDSFAATLDPTPKVIRLLLNKRGAVRIESKQLINKDVYRLTLATRPIDSGEVFLYHKTTRRETYDHHLQEHPEFDDVLLFNNKRELTESCIANIVVVKNGLHYTPPIECGLLGGTYRQRLLDERKLEERIIPLDSLKTYDELYLLNSVRGRLNVSLEQ